VDEETLGEVHRVVVVVTPPPREGIKRIPIPFDQLSQGCSGVVRVANTGAADDAPVCRLKATPGPERSILLKQFISHFPITSVLAGQVADGGANVIRRATGLS
jgi:hypothetical protein